MAICREDKEKKSKTISIRREKTKLFANDITLCTDTPKEASKKISRNKKSLAKLLEIKIKYAGRALHQPGGGTFLFFTQRPQQAPGDRGWTIWYRVTDVENAPTTPEGWPQEAIAAPPWTQQPAGWQSRDRLSPCHRPLLPERDSILQVPDGVCWQQLNYFGLSLQRRWGKQVPDILLFNKEQCLNHSLPPLPRPRRWGIPQPLEGGLEAGLPRRLPHTYLLLLFLVFVSFLTFLAF